jgi:head-tail adaptor
MTGLGLSADELNQMRDDIEELLPDTCSILAMTYVSDNQGGLVETWGTATGGTAVSCRIDFASGSELLTSAAVQPFTRAMLSVPYDTSLTTANRVVWGSYTFNVLSVNLGQSWNVVRRAVLEEVA